VSSWQQELLTGGLILYLQNYNPMGNVFLSTVVAAIPIVSLLYFIALHPHRDQHGVKHLGIAAPYAAFYGVIAAFVVSCLAFGMPLAGAFSAFGLGVLSGFLGIIWIVLGAMFLYTMTVITGKFEIVKESIRWRKEPGKRCSRCGRRPCAAGPPSPACGGSPPGRRPSIS